MLVMNLKTITCIGIVLAFSCMPVQAGPSFSSISEWTGDSSFVFSSGMSSDASVLVATRNTIGGREGVRWSRQGGTVGLGDLPGGDFNSTVSEVSADGSVIVGVGKSAGGNQAFMWTEADGMIGLGFYDDGREFSVSTAVSADGTVVVGSAAESGYEPSSTAFRWTAAEGMVSLGILPFDDSYSRAQDVSADGSVVVGISDNSTSDKEGEAFRWTAEDGMVGLGNLGGTNVGSSANAVSADGNVIVGWVQGSVEIPGIQAFRWTEETGMVGLGFAPNQHYSEAYAVSGNGSVIVGGGSDTSGAFIWDEVHGMRNLEDYLSNDLGIDLAGWRLTRATEISPDGRIITGWGYDPDGDRVGWIAVVPEPSTMTLSAIAILLGAACTIRRTVRRSSP